MGRSGGSKLIKEYIKGDLLSHRGPIAHGCNAQGVMASGVAKAIRDKFPGAFAIYRDEYQRNHDFLDLGTFTVYKELSDSSTAIIYNLVTQRFYGRDPNRRYVSYDAIADVFTRLNERYPQDFAHIDLLRGCALGIPKIGAGLGNGSWDVIEAIINDVTPNLDIWVYEL